MAQHDRTELIAALNEDLANEYASVIQYRTFASTVRGPHRPTLRPMFAAEITDELEHAELLADYIVALGGTPTVTPAEVVLAESAQAMLQSIVEAEDAAVQRYVERREMAEAAGEHGLAVSLDDVIADETRHRDETRLVLEGWSPGGAAEQGAAERAPSRMTQPSRRAAGSRADDVPLAASGRGAGGPTRGQSDRSSRGSR